MQVVQFHLDIDPMLSWAIFSVVGIFFYNYQFSTSSGKFSPSRKSLDFFQKMKSLTYLSFQDMGRNSNNNSRGNARGRNGGNRGGKRDGRNSETSGRGGNGNGPRQSKDPPSLCLTTRPTNPWSTGNPTGPSIPLAQLSDAEKVVMRRDSALRCAELDG